MRFPVSSVHPRLSGTLVLWFSGPLALGRLVHTGDGTGIFVSCVLLFDNHYLPLSTYLPTPSHLLIIIIIPSYPYHSSVDLVCLSGSLSVSSAYLFSSHVFCIDRKQQHTHTHTHTPTSVPPTLPTTPTRLLSTYILVFLRVTTTHDLPPR
ncbi:hypothetical protein F4780DRAFT_491631 [Xylariomycetidae sp. FL0641]|nr:hypothetical protein F4780DRAFT_491631 [Xylariomycetidae sp. FL0641]